MRATLASAALLCVFASVLFASRAACDPIAVQVTPGGLALTTSRAVGTARRREVIARLAPSATLVSQDATAGWAIVQVAPPIDPDATFVILNEQARRQQRVWVQWPGGPRGGRGSVVDESSPGALVLRYLEAGEAAPPEGAAVVDANHRLLGIVLRSSRDGASALPAVLAVSELRSVIEQADAPQVHDATTVHSPQRHAPAPSAPPPLGAGLVAAARAATLRLPDDAHLGVALQGDGFIAAASAPFHDLPRGCGTASGASGASSAVLYTVDATTGLALLRQSDSPSRAGLPLATMSPIIGASVFVVPIEGDALRATVVSATEHDVHVRFDRDPGVAAGLAVVDLDGRLVGLSAMSTCAGSPGACDAFVTRAAPLSSTIDALADPGATLTCERATGEPVIPASAVTTLGGAEWALAVHVGSDLVYATLANRLHDVATGCIVRRPGYQNGEVLGVDAAANVALFHVIEPRPVIDAPTREEAPLVLVESRPTSGRRVRAVGAASVGVASSPTVVGTIAEARGDDLLVDFVATTGDARRALVQGAPVLDDDGRVVGLVDLVVTGHRYRLRSAAAIRRLLASIRRDQPTGTCFPTYGSSQGFVTAGGMNFGFEFGTLAEQGMQYHLAADLLWYNTWYFRAELGVRLSDEPLPRFMIAGGPLFFRSPGDGEVGFGAHIEIEPGFNHDQARAERNGAQRALYGFEVQGMPYASNSVGILFALAGGAAQYGSFVENHFGFGMTFTLGVIFGSLRHDRP